MGHISLGEGYVLEYRESISLQIHYGIDQMIPSHPLLIS